MTARKTLCILAAAGAVAALGIWSSGLIADAGAEAEGHDAHHAEAGRCPMAGQGGRQMKMRGECPMKARHERDDDAKHECPMKAEGECPMKADDESAKALARENAPKLAEALAAVEDATRAVDSGADDAAAEALAEAKSLIAAVHESLSAHLPQPVNTRCPIMGSPVDPANVPDELTREHDGKVVAFCCGGCPAAWDRLSEEQKEAKLDDVLSEDD